MLEAEAIETLRKRTLQQIQCINEKDNFIDTIDIDLITNTDDLLWRFILHDLDVNDKIIDKSDLNQVNFDHACKLLVDTLKWRKQFGLHTLTNSNIPVEFYRMKMFTYTHMTDVKRIFLFIRASKYINISSNAREFIIKAILYEIEKKVISISPLYTHGLCDLKPLVVLDCTGLTMQAIDIQLVVNILTLVAHHFPMLIDELWLYRVPWFAKYVVPILMKAIPRNVSRRMMQLSYEEAKGKIGDNLLPKFMGGSCPIDPDLEVPSDAGTLDQLAESFAFKQSELDKFRKHLASLKDD